MNADRDLDAVLSRIERDGLISLAGDLIGIPSFKGGGEQDLAAWLAEFFNARGYEVELQEVRPGRVQPIATLPGSGGGKTLMFNGHIDMDPLRADAVHPPFTPVVEGDQLYGAGARNMKGGLAAMIGAAEAIRTSSMTLRGDLVVACVIGELEGGIGTAHLVERNCRCADAAVLPEPVGADVLVTTFAGIYEFVISTVGLSEHMTRQSADTVDAIRSMELITQRLRSHQFTWARRAHLPDLPMVNIGGIIGGRGRHYDLRGPNYVSDYCSIFVDIRYPPGVSVSDVESEVRTLLREVTEQYAGVKWELSRAFPDSVGAEPANFDPTEVPVNADIVQCVRRQYRALKGVEPAAVGAVVPWSYAAGDASHLWRAGIPCLFFGPNSPPRGAGDYDDCVSIEQLDTVSRVLAMTAVEYCG